MKHKLLPCIVLLALYSAACPAAGEENTARQMLDAAGVGGGLVVHLGCGDGTLTAALRADESYLVHGLDRDPKNVTAARSRIMAKDLYGPVTVERLTGDRLPYVDDTVKLIVASRPEGISMGEIRRVLCPDGIALLQLDGGRWKKITEPRPDTIDEWTHYLYDPTNNAVGHDTAVGPPHHLQWVGGPKWARSHEHLASMSAAVSTGGRVFYIIDEGPVASVQLPPRWRMAARDAFSGVVLWKRDIPEWEDHLRGFRSGPVDITRRLVAAGDRVFVTLGYGAPVSVLDPATGKTVKTYEGTEDTREILYSDGMLFLVAGDPSGKGAAEPREVKGRWHCIPNRARTLPEKHLTVLYAETGEVLWTKDDADTADIMPATLAVSGDRVFFENDEAVFCLNAKTGEQIWRTTRNIVTTRAAYSAPTLVVHDGVVISADRNARQPYVKGADLAKDRVTWIISSQGGRTKPGMMYAYDAADGKKLWESDCKELYNEHVDVLVANDLVWTGHMVGRNEPGMTEMRHFRSGKVAFKRPPDKKYINVGMYHHRCYRNKATPRFAILGRTGVEFVDMKTGELIPHHWVRGGCAYGVLPCNGLLYAPPHSCACYIRAKLTGFVALAAKRTAPPQPTADDRRLEKGPAFGKGGGPKAGPADWPTYRANPARYATCGSLPGTKLAPAWKSPVGGRLSPLTAAGGSVYVAAVDRHTVHALNADTGEEQWSFVAGGRVDSPPTCHEGRLLFGSADGHVYCLRADDGALAWTFRAAPADRRLFSYGRLESVWPVHGSILVDDGVAWFAAGRCSYIDGGIYVYRLNAATGEQLSVTRVDDRDPKTGLEPQKTISGFSMEGALPDILSRQDGRVYMRHRCFDRKGAEQKPLPHMFSSVGYLDGNWWHRTYWIIAETMGDGWGGWPNRGNQVPSGRLLILRDGTVYGYGRTRYYQGGGHLRMGGTTYRLFACKRKAGGGGKKGKKKGKSNIDYLWNQNIDTVVRAMLLAGDTLVLAGPPDPSTGAQLTVAAIEGEKGGRLQCRSAASGEKVSGIALDAMPVFDGLIAAGGRLYLSSVDGEVVCIQAR